MNLMTRSLILLITFSLIKVLNVQCIDWNTIDIEHERACDPHDSLIIHKKHVGRITSPSPGWSWLNRTCNWTLLAPEGHQVWLKLIQLKLDDEKRGSLQIFEGTSFDSNNLIERFEGSKQFIPFDTNPIISRRNVLHISYSGIIVGTRKPSFMIEYMFLKPELTCADNQLKCRHNSNDDYGPFFNFNNQCYHRHQQCDGIDDCGDGSDEENCTFNGINLTPKPSQSANCGVPTVPIRTTRRRTKIKGGMVAIKGSWPWMAGLFQGNLGPVRGLVCGAVLISDRWLISAAHCFDSILPMKSKWTIQLGLDRKFYGNTSNMAIRYIDSIHFPVGWKNFQEKDDLSNNLDDIVDDGKNDIALIKMNAPIPNGNTNIIPICLPSINETVDLVKPGARSLIAGWGDMDEHRLKQGNVPIWDKNSCQQRFNEIDSSYMDIDDSIICAGEIKGGDDTCFGDSGGPLIIYNPTKNHWNVIGITSQGFDNNCQEGPGLYTSINYFLDWINNIMSNN